MNPDLKIVQAPEDLAKLTLHYWAMDKEGQNTRYFTKILEVGDIIPINERGK